MSVPIEEMTLAEEKALRESMEGMSKRQLALLKWRMTWAATARPKQLAPLGNWFTWGIMSGRGFGKTRAGANWLGIEALSDPGSFNFVIAPTRDDVRYTCFEGETGLLSCIPEILIEDYNKSDLILYISAGGPVSVIRGFGSEKPERLRGPQHHRGWCDELAAWTNAGQCWKMMQFGLRLGKKTQCVWTTTPKPVPIIKERTLEEDSRHVITRGTTYENRANLAESFYQEVAKYEGTKIGRQELHGELLDPEESGIIQRSQWRLWPANKPLPRFQFVLMSLDTAFTEKTFDQKEMEADPTACTVWGLFTYNKLMNVMLLDAWDDYLGLPALIKRVKAESAITYGMADEPLISQPYVSNTYNSMAEDAPIMKGRGVSQILVEDKGSGISLRQMLGLENLLLEPYNPGRADKLARGHQITPMFSHGRVWVVESEKFPAQCRVWADPCISQICSYHGPGTTENDDYWDTMTQALNFFMRKFVRDFIPLTPEQIEKKQDEERLANMPKVNPYAQ